MADPVPLPLVPGLHFVPVERSKMKAPREAKRMHARETVGDAGMTPLPSPPPSLDLSKRRSIPYPMLGNDSKGDCYYASAVKHVSTWTGQYGPPKTWTAEEVVSAYLRLAGGDNGLFTEQIMSEWLAGLCQTDHRRIAYLVITNPDDLQLAAYLFGGVQFTAALPTRWVNVAKPGGTWDALPRDRANPAYGHALYLSGYDKTGFKLETWGFDRPITITRGGCNVCDMEAVAVFSKDMFGPDGKAPNGYDYSQLREWWMNLGGDDPGPAPSPVPPAPIPVPDGEGFTGTLTFWGGKLLGVGGSPKPAGLELASIAEILIAILQLLRKGWTADMVIAMLSPSPDARQKPL